MLKLKVKKRKKHLVIRLYNQDKSYRVTFFSGLKVRIEIDYCTDYLIKKHGYNHRHLGY